MKRNPVLLVAIAVLAGLFTARFSRADDETSQVEIKLRAPIDATACTATPPTITVLGLTIDVSAASFGESGDGGDQLGGDGSGSGEDSSGGGTGAATCDALAVGQMVEVKLSGDTAPLMATEVGAEGDDGIRVQAPVQSADTTAQTITLLGLTIDVSHADLNGENDSDDEGSDDAANNQPADLTQVTAGQFVEVQLDASQLPALVATSAEIKNMTNEVEVEIDDADGQEVEDSGDDMDVSVTDTVVVQTTAANGSTHRARKQLQLHRSASGSFVLSGLPTGRATITITRTAGGVTTSGHRHTKVRPNQIRPVRLRLR